MSVTLALLIWQTLKQLKSLAMWLISLVSSWYAGLLELKDGEWITKSDGADDSNIEGAKGGISDALKRAAVLFGIGRYLYHPNAFDRSKKAAVWATPEGFDELMEKRNETKK